MGGTANTYIYDNLQRLTKAVATNSANQATGSWLYCYDNNGNRTADTTTIGATTCPTAPGPGAGTYSNDTADALTARNGSTSGFATDANRNQNQTSFIGSQTYNALAYNARNQVSLFLTSGQGFQSASYAGDTNAARTSQGHNSYANIMLGLAEQSGDTGETYFTHDPSGTLIAERINGTSHYYLYDGTGNITGLTDTTGAVVNTYTYDPYAASLGKTEQVPNPYQYDVHPPVPFGGFELRKNQGDCSGPPGPPPPYVGPPLEPPLPLP